MQHDWDDNEPVCVDTFTAVNGENPVVLFYLHSGHTEKLADSFIDCYQDYRGKLCKTLVAGMRAVSG